ncbi:hypothetical protein BVRB_6g136360 [Beta vulgaris subsp. vulgaris]|nr:hypothetical protein BVRB_6g136360 [Beta vulgaris subsp. vulgaris]
MASSSASQGLLNKEYASRRPRRPNSPVTARLTSHQWQTGSNLFFFSNF